MARKNLDGNWMGASRSTTIRISVTDQRNLNLLREAWGLDQTSAIIRRALCEAADRQHRRMSEAGPGGEGGRHAEAKAPTD